MNRSIFVRPDRDGTIFFFLSPRKVKPSPARPWERVSKRVTPRYSDFSKNKALRVRSEGLGGLGRTGTSAHEPMEILESGAGAF